MSKEGLFAHFKAKGLKNGTAYTSAITVDFSAADVDPADSLEEIIDKCAHVAVREYKKADLQFEGLQAV